MKVANNHQRRKITTTRFLATLLIISITASLVGCTPAFCADDNADKTLLERFENFADRAAQAAKSIGDALDSAAEAVIDAIKQPQATTQPNDSEPLLPTGGGFGPYCPPFEEELDVYYTYEELDVFLDQDQNRGLDDYFVDICGIYIYAFSPINYSNSVLAEEFERIYGYAPNYFPSEEMVGQFYINGDDWVPVYKLSAEYRDYTLIWYDEKRDGNYTYLHDNGAYEAGFEKIFGEWENADVFDDNADCWKELEEYEKTDEYKNRYMEMLDWMCQASGMTVSEMREDEHFKICYCVFFSNVSDLEGNVFSVFRMFCKYEPDIAAEETPPATEPSEPAAE